MEHELAQIAVGVHLGALAAGALATVVRKVACPPQCTAEVQAATQLFTDLHRVHTEPSDVVPEPCLQEQVQPVSCWRSLARALRGRHPTLRFFTCVARGLTPFARAACLTLHTSVPLLLICIAVRIFGRDGVPFVPFDDTRWCFAAAGLSVLSSSVQAHWLGSKVIRAAQRWPARARSAQALNSRQPRFADMPPESCVVLEQPPEGAGRLVQHLHAFRALGRVIGPASEREDDDRLAVRFAGARVTLPLRYFRLICSSADHGIVVSGAAGRAAEEERPGTGPAKGARRGRGVSVIAPRPDHISGRPGGRQALFMDTGFASADDAGPFSPSAAPSAEEERKSHGSSTTERSGPVDLKGHEVETAPWLPSEFNLERIADLTVTEDTAYTCAAEELECHRPLVAVSVLMSHELALGGFLCQERALPKQILTPAAPELLEQLAAAQQRLLVHNKRLGRHRDPKLPPVPALTRRALLDEIARAEARRPLWRLATEAVVLLELPLAAALFALDLCVANPDVVTLLFHKAPPHDLYAGLAMFTHLRHVGVEWARFYAERKLAMATHFDFLRYWKLGTVTPGDLHAILRSPPPPVEHQRPAYLTRSQAKERKKMEEQLDLAVTLLNVDKFGNAELSDYAVQWEDAVEAVLDGEYVRASHLFMAADHPNDPELPDGGKGNVLGSIEYGRLVARHYAINLASAGLLNLNPADYAAIFIVQEETPTAFPWRRLLHRHQMEAHPEEGWTPPNRTLGEFVRTNVPGSPNCLHCRSPLLGTVGQALDFASFLLARPGSLRRGSGSVVSPCFGLRSAIQRIRAGEALCLWEGRYPIVEIRHVIGYPEEPVYILPRGYLEAASAHFKENVDRGEVSEADRACLLPPLNIYDRAVFGGARSAAENDLLHLVHCRDLRLSGLTFDNGQDGIGLHLTLRVSVIDCFFSRISQRPVDGNCNWEQEAEWGASRHQRVARTGLGRVFLPVCAAATAVVVSVVVNWAAPDDADDRQFVLVLWLVALGADIIGVQSIVACFAGLLTHAAEEYSLAPEPPACELHPSERKQERKTLERKGRLDLGHGWQLTAGAAHTDSDKKRQAEREAAHSVIEHDVDDSEESDFEGLDYDD